jgi:PHD/YefM family antitoxin component YafN of YafNO toxin-antitoxin module
VSVEKIIADHQPLKVTVSDGADFVVISAEDWERETLYVQVDHRSPANHKKPH